MTPVPWRRIHWPNTLFLGTTLLLAVTAVPAYVGHFGLGGFQLLLFLGFFMATGLSITLGYHRLFSHRSFQARWPVRLFTLVFGAAAFENSVLCWAADHRQHHKFADQDEDPYDISKGLFHAHIGWILFRLQPDTSRDNVKDLVQDRLVLWQHRHYRLLAVGVGLGLPAVIGGLWGGAAGALGGLLLAGLARVVIVQHLTFFINSLCHTVGRQTYSSRCTARDSAILAMLTFGEGYHNFHHAFQHDYRNGVKPWQFDPTKWSVWLLQRLGLASNLRRVPLETILLAEAAEQQRQLAAALAARAVPPSHPVHACLQAAKQHLQLASENWERRWTEYRRSAERKVEASRDRMAQARREVREASHHLRAALRDWRQTHRRLRAQLA
jgi:stearoyl-CoA desaturase (Delta-9 desaturase)